MTKKYLVSMLLVSTGSFGCALDSIHEPPKVVNNYSPNTVVAQSIEIDNRFETLETEELTLPQALALTLEKSPELKSFSYSLRVGEARIIQAGLYPNPELSLVVEDVLGSKDYEGTKRSQSTLQLSQIIELGDKRSARVNAATALRDQFKDDYEIKRIEILTSLTDKFIRTVADEHLLQLANKGEDLARQALQNIQKRSQAGGVSELEETKAKVLLARAHIEAQHAEHALLSSKRELARFWGADSPKFSKISSDLFQTTSLPTLEELSSRIDKSLEIKKWITEKRLREAEKKLAEAKSVPNLLLGAGARRIEADDSESFVFQLSVPLTIFDRNQGARQEAAILNDKVDIDEKASRLRLNTTLFGLYQEAKHAGTVIKTMQSEVIPQAERSLRIAQGGYDQGRFSYLDLLDAQRTLIEVSRENIEAAYTLHSYVNSIERLLGASLSADEAKLN